MKLTRIIKSCLSGLLAASMMVSAWGQGTQSGYAPGQEPVGPKTTGANAFKDFVSNRGAAPGQPLPMANQTPCPAQTLTWTNGGDTCSSSTAATGNGVSVSLNDSTAPATGNATFTCRNGNYMISAGATCVSGQDCPAGPVSWSVSGSTCTGNTPQLLANGQTSPTVFDNVAPTTGSATFDCANGTLTPSAGASCQTQASQSACSAQSVNWTVGGATCDGSTPALASGSSATVTDSGAPSTGSASFTCNNGVLSTSPGASCSVPANCGAQAVNWTVGSNTCNANYPGASHGGSITATDSTAPTTGSATYSCNNGAITLQAGATCTAPMNCGPTAVSWTVGAATCNATTPAITSGSTGSATDSTSPTTGSANYACSNGSLTLQGGATCTDSTPANCASQAVSWTVGGVTCNGTAASAAHGGSVSVSDAGAPSTGSANFTCSNGTYAVASGAVCGNSCSAASYTWTQAANSCGGAPPSLAHGASGVVNDSTAPTTGSANVTCNNGAYNTTSSTCTVTAANCASQSVSWSQYQILVGTFYCSATAPATATGTNVNVVDNSSAGGGVGSATYSCSNGTLSLLSGSCAAPAACPSQSLSWTGSGGATCYVTAPKTDAGSSATLTPVGMVGSATFQCRSDATWASVPDAGATCKVKYCVNIVTSAYSFTSAELSAYDSVTPLEYYLVGAAGGVAINSAGADLRNDARAAINNGTLAPSQPFDVYVGGGGGSARGGSPSILGGGGGAGYLGGGGGGASASSPDNAYSGGGGSTGILVPGTNSYFAYASGTGGMAIGVAGYTLSAAGGGSNSGGAGTASGAPGTTGAGGDAFLQGTGYTPRGGNLFNGYDGGGSNGGNGSVWNYYGGGGGGLGSGGGGGNGGGLGANSFVSGVDAMQYNIIVPDAVGRRNCVTAQLYTASDPVSCGGNAGIAVLRYIPAGNACVTGFTYRVGP